MICKARAMYIEAQTIHSWSYFAFSSFNSQLFMSHQFKQVKLELQEIKYSTSTCKQSTRGS